jgi:hypothetical protein
VCNARAAPLWRAAGKFGMGLPLGVDAASKGRHTMSPTRKAIPTKVTRVGSVVTDAGSSYENRASACCTLRRHLAFTL